MNRFINIISIFTIIIAVLFGHNAVAQKAVWPAKTHYKTQEVNGHKMFYREAGKRSNKKPTIVLLHGWASSSHYFREIIPLLSGRYHIIAPDNLGSGYSAKPDPTKTPYTFELLAEQVSGLLKAIDVDEFIIYVQDFGAPVGFRTMMRDPAKVKGIIAQNGNAYLEGLGGGVEDFFKQQSKNVLAKNIEDVQLMPLDVIVNAYKGNVKDTEHLLSPDSWTHDSYFTDEKLEQLIQFHLTKDYVSNLQDYPKWQKVFREYQPATLAIWGEKDAFFVAAGGKAFKKDIPKAKYVGMADAGHYATEEKPVFISKHIIKYMEKNF